MPVYLSLFVAVLVSLSPIASASDRADFEALCTCSGPPECGGGNVYDSSTDVRASWNVPIDFDAKRQLSKAKAACNIIKSKYCLPNKSLSTSGGTGSVKCTVSDVSYRRIGATPTAEAEKDIHALAREVVAFAREAHHKEVSGATLEESNSPENMGGMCGVFQQSVNQYICENVTDCQSDGLAIAEEQPQVLNFATNRDTSFGEVVASHEQRWQTGALETTMAFQRYFTVMVLPDGTAILFDPSFTQFSSEACLANENTRQVHPRLLERPNGAAIFAALSTDGYLILDEAVANSYGYSITGANDRTLADLTGM